MSSCSTATARDFQRLTPRLAWLVPLIDGSVREGIVGWLGVVEIEFSRLRLLKKLAAAVAQKLMQSHLHFEGRVSITSVRREVVRMDERDPL